MPARLLVFGLDGANWELIGRGIREGRLPTFQALLGRSLHGDLKSTLPFMTPPAWTSSFTGVNPGAHGIQDFFSCEEETYAQRFATSADCASETVFSRLSKAGRTVCAINIPFSYPPEAVNGIHVSGFGTPDAESDYVYPKDEREEFKGIYDVFANPSEFGLQSYHREEEYARQVNAFTDNLHRVTSKKLSSRAWDAFIVVFDGTDRLQHKFWKHFDCSHPLHASADKKFARVIPEHYERLDGMLRDLVLKAGPDAAIMAYSDHGFGPVRRYVFVNRVFEKAGLFVWKHSKVERALARLSSFIKAIASLAISLGMKRMIASIKRRMESLHVRSAFLDLSEWGRTKAFLSSASGIGVRLNVLGREPEGIVSPEDAPKVRESVRRLLLGLLDPETGRAPFDEVVLREEAYHGACLGRAPDLLLVPAEGYSVARGWSEAPFVHVGERMGGISGNHRPLGMFALAAPGVVPGRRDPPPRIEDIAPTILEILGVPIPEGLDGNSLLGGKPTAPAPPPPPPPSSPNGGSAYTPGEEEALKRRLEDLGYL